MLYELLSQNLIEANVPATDREDAIRKVGDMMVRGGYVTPGYVDGMVKVAEEMGGYIVITSGVAMPHSRPETGAKKICAALISLKDPIPFGNEVNDPVKLVIGIAAVDADTHLEMLSNIVEVFDDEDVVCRLKESKTSDEMLEIIRRKIMEE